MASRLQRLLVVALTILSCILLAPTAVAAPGSGNGAPPMSIDVETYDYEAGWPCDFPITEELSGKFGGAGTPKFMILTAPSLRTVLTNSGDGDGAGTSVTLNLTGPVQETVGGTGPNGGTLLHDRYRGHGLLFEPPAVDDEGNALFPGSDEWATHFTYVRGPATVTFEELHLDGDGWPDWYHIVDVEYGNGTTATDPCTLID